MASLLSLPPEICSTICEYVDTGLAPLCRISHSFRDQAQRMMYRKVDLQDCNMRLVKSWCLVITRNPHLANRVWGLILQLPNTLEPKEAELLSRAFAVCVHLKRLAVHHMPGSRPENNSQDWIVKGPFQLERFFNTYFDTLYTVLAHQQTHIRVLSLPSTDPSSWSSYREYELPNLIAIDAPLEVVGCVAEAKFAAPLERIQIHQDRLNLSSLSRFAPTLTTLSIVRERGFIGSATVAVIDEVLKVFPRLQHFSVYEKERQGVATMEDSIIRRLQQFTSLTTLTWHLCRWVSPSEPPMGCRGLRDRRELLWCGLTMLAACATLRKASISVRLASLRGGIEEEQEAISCTVSEESSTFDDDQHHELEESDSFYATIFD
ncbi:hypothetical protein FB45DRAFT_1018902 [Roridomyces roridus]|uniref:F-box domain-containing protein n=1 Tax=Roridomyces roridus TaxID=1738132 RepID=A0AAD7CFP1_9AGAR|nr:hypothetical protein FB45DRAFT_1018902 [Roridomyces roridus]